MADCEWNPAENRPAFEDDPPHSEATWSVGVDGKWHLCDGCAALPAFARYRRRSQLHRRRPPRVIRIRNRKAAIEQLRAAVKEREWQQYTGLTTEHRSQSGRLCQEQE